MIVVVHTSLLAPSPPVKDLDVPIPLHKVQHLHLSSIKPIVIRIAPSRHAQHTAHVLGSAGVQLSNAQDALSRMGLPSHERSGVDFQRRHDRACLPSNRGKQRLIGRSSDDGRADLAPAGEERRAELRGRGADRRGEEETRLGRIEDQDRRASGRMQRSESVREVLHRARRVGEVGDTVEGELGNVEALGPIQRGT